MNGVRVSQVRILDVPSEEMIISLEIRYLPKHIKMSSDEELAFRSSLRGVSPLKRFPYLCPLVALGGEFGGNPELVSSALDICRSILRDRLDQPDHREKCIKVLLDALEAIRTGDPDIMLDSLMKLDYLPPIRYVGENFAVCDETWEKMFHFGNTSNLDSDIMRYITYMHGERALLSYSRGGKLSLALMEALIHYEFDDIDLVKRAIDTARMRQDWVSLIHLCDLHHT